MDCKLIVPQKQHEKPTEPKILVLEYPDGYREYYSDVRVHIHVQKVLDAPGIEGEKLAREYAELTIPPSHRGLDDARKLVATFDSKSCTVADFVTRQASLGSLRIMDAYQKRASQ